MGWKPAWPLGLALVCWLGLAALRAAEPERAVCVVCEKPLAGGTVGKHARGYVCESCLKLAHRCWVCGLPLREAGVTTGDGRWICKFDAPEAVLTAAEAQRVFEQTRAYLGSLTDGQFALKQAKVAVSLFDVDYWNSDRGQPLPAEQRRFGFAHSRRDGETWHHSILLHSGLPAPHLMSICAHEYTHLWVNENLAQTRTLDPDSLEALCEVVAYRLMDYRQNPREKERVRANPYTRGKIQVAIELEQRHGLSALLDWVRYGTAPVLEAATLDVRRTPSYPVWTRPAGPKERPDALRLRGLSGPVNRRMALINEQHFLVGDEKDVELKSGPLRVRCLRILENAVVVQCAGGTNSLTLRLGN